MSRLSADALPAGARVAIFAAIAAAAFAAGAGLGALVPELRDHVTDTTVTVAPTPTTSGGHSEHTGEHATGPAALDIGSRS